MRKPKTQTSHTYVVCIDVDTIIVAMDLGVPSQKVLHSSRSNKFGISGKCVNLARRRVLMDQV